MMGTGCWNRQLGLLNGSSNRRQVCLELGGRSIGKCRVEAVTIVDVIEEGADC
jgi:hypothetical protein